MNRIILYRKLDTDSAETAFQFRIDFFEILCRDVSGVRVQFCQDLRHSLLHEGMTPNPRNTFLLMTLKNKKGEVLSEETFYFNFAKDQDLPKADIRYKVKQMDGKCEITLSSKQLARDVFIEIPKQSDSNSLTVSSLQGARFSDNFFDLLPGQTKKVVVTSEELMKDGKLDIRIHQLSDTN